MWERFSYYGMRGFLIFYMTAAVSAGGMGLDTATAAAIYGTYTSLVYLMSVPGGWLADRVLGQRKAVLYGGILIACGHYTLAVPHRRIVLRRARAHRARHRPPQAEHQRDRRAAVRSGRRPPRRRLLDLLHGDQPRRVPGAAAHRVPGAGRTLPRAHRGMGHGSELGVALRVRRGRRRHDARTDPVRGDGPGNGIGGAQAGRRDHAGARGRSTSGKRFATREAPARSSVAVALLALAGVISISPTHRPRLHRLFAPRHHRRLLRHAVPRSELDAAGAGPSVGDLRVLRLRRDLLVGVRAGRLDAEPLRRSQHAQRDPGVRLPEQLVPVAERAVHHRLRADVRVAVAEARPEAAVSAGEVLVRADLAWASAS